MLNSLSNARDSDPWNVVVEYLQSIPPSNKHSHLPYTLDTQLSGGNEQLPLLGSGETTLGAIRRRAWQQQNPADVAGAPLSDSVPPPGTSDVVGDLEWAAKQLRKLSDLDSPDFASASRVWQLPNAELSRLCRAHLSLNNCNGAALAGFIDSAVSNPEVSLENQHLLLQCAASSTWFTKKDAIPAIVQSKVLAILRAHLQVIVSGLLLSLLERSQHLSPSAVAMIVKAIKADMSSTALEAMCSGLASLAAKTPAVVCSALFQVMEALVGAMPADWAHIEWTKAWVDVLEIAARTDGDSKKLGALMLHLLNKFGSRLDSTELDRIAAAASVLTTSLKKAILAAVLRKKGKAAS
ncbi:hypothetical protein IWW37_000181 [Coemansia sp. RSA 2050]|nr:hypothetical protein IWW37_000181 [Coemansia sp. RSA 2050]KAJ2737137.1 hypothetical protein IW152_000158 [Coemansia sp. BCRC 34962]